MRRRRVKEKTLQKKIAVSRMKRLFQLAETAALQRQQDLADRYIELARRISMRCLVPIPREFKRCYCKHCYGYLLPGVNSRVRIQRGRLVFFCGQCKQYTRIPIRPRVSSTSRATGKKPPGVASARLK